MTIFIELAIFTLDQLCPYDMKDLENKYHIKLEDNLEE